MFEPVESLLANLSYRRSGTECQGLDVNALGLWFPCKGCEFRHVQFFLFCFANFIETKDDSTNCKRRIRCAVSAKVFCSLEGFGIPSEQHFESKMTNHEGMEEMS